MSEANKKSTLIFIFQQIHYLSDGIISETNVIMTSLLSEIFVQYDEGNWICTT